MSLKRLSISVLVFAGIIVACVGVWNWTLSMGWEVMKEEVRNAGYCPDPSACVLETETTRDLLADQTGMAPSVIQWCYGVIKWDETEVRRGGFIKSLLVQTMAIPCGPLFDGE